MGQLHLIEDDSALESKQASSDTSRSLDARWSHYTSGNRADSKRMNIVGFQLYGVPGIVQCLETDSGMVAGGS